MTIIDSLTYGSDMGSLSTENRHDARQTDKHLGVYKTFYSNNVTKHQQTDPSADTVEVHCLTHSNTTAAACYMQ